MKILIATQCRSIIGGLETYVQALIPALLKRGHELAMLYDYPGSAEGGTIDPPEAELPVWYCETLRKNPGQWREVTDWGPDIIYAQSCIDIDKALAGWPTVLYAHNYWATCATGQKCHTFPTIRTCTRTLGPMCLILHYPRRCGGLNPISAWTMLQEQLQRKSQLNDFRAILVASRHMYGEFERHGVHPRKLHLVRLPLTSFPASAPPLAQTLRGHLLFVGRLTRVKGVDFLINAVPLAEKKLGRTLTLTVAGDGAQLEDLQALAARKQVAAQFVGWVGDSRKRELMRDADLLVVPSLWPEPFGLVGIEAGCMGVPAAGFAVGGIPDWLIPGKTGELAASDPPTVQGLADAIVRALADQNHYNDLRRGACEMSQQFTLERHASELEAILQAGAAEHLTQDSRALVS